MNSVAFFLRSYVRRLPQIIEHRCFFWAILVFFAIHAMWLAFSVAYPMIFDEEYHMGIIDIYSRQWSPFISMQPVEAALYGDITRYSSYLYHYIASFPYRVVSLFTADVQTHIIALRLLNIAVVLAALGMYRKVLLLLRAPKLLVHVALLFFVMIPLVPYAAAQVSYDPATYLLVPLMAYCLIKITKSDHWFLWLACLGVIGVVSSLIKFTMLPFFAVFFVVSLVIIAKRHGRQTLAAANEQIRKSRFWLVAVLGLSIALSLTLFVERYGVNVAEYGSLTPDCAVVQPVEVCQQYSPWARNEELSQQQREKPQPVDSMLVYTVVNWLPHIVDDFFVVAVYPSAGGSVLHQGTPQNLEGSAGQLLSRMAGWAGFILGIIVVAWQWRHLRKYGLLLVCLGAAAVYVLILHARNYSEYVEFALPIAIQGRYILPILPFVFLAILLGLQTAFGRTTKAILFTAGFLAFACGAGALTYILYSQPLWSWPEMVDANLLVQSILTYIRW